MAQGCLFGWEHSPGKGMPGRPPFLWTRENSNKIKLLLALGWSNERIAGAIGITAPTLRKVFFLELKVRDFARDAMMARRLELCWEQVEAGNVGAMKLLDQIVASNDLALSGRRLRGDSAPDAPQAPKPKAVPKGKKDQAVDRASALIEADPDLLSGMGRPH